MDLEQVMQALRTADQRAQSGDEQAAQDARRLAQIAQQLRTQQAEVDREPALSQTNLGIADAVGGLVDLINPLDTPAVSQALGLGDRLTTGSAREGLVRGMQATGMAGEDRPPEGVIEASLRGGGQAAGALIPAAGTAGALSRAPGMLGQAANTVRGGMSTAPAVAAEVAAGGVSGAAMEGTERALEGSDMPEWAQDLLVTTAGVAAPVAALPAATYAAGRAAGAVANFSPAVNAGRAVAGAVAPYTRRGAEAIARRRMEELAGGRDRAIELGERINPNNEFGLSPAQQTGEPRMVALEQSARAGDAALDDMMRRQFAESMGGLRRATDDIGGNVGDAQTFFREARARYTTEMRSVAQQAVRNAEERLREIAPNRAEGDNSLIVMEEISRARDAARVQENRLWESVPRGAQVGTSRAREVLAQIEAETGQARQTSIPATARRLLGEEGTFGERETVLEMHDLYSELRETARNAMAGTNVQRRLAANANAIADAILEDLGAVDGTTAIGRQINEARAFSQALHQTFDQGAYGRLSRRTVEGDTATDPDLALERSVGRAGTTGSVSARQLERAGAGLSEAGAPGRPNLTVSDAIQDFIRGRFSERAFTFDANGQETLNRRGAAQFVRDNRELIERYPGLRAEILEAADQQQTADQVAATIARRIEAVENGRTNPVAGFADATQETAIRSIIDAENPVRAAQAVLSQARRDPSGAAVDGIKAVFSDEIIRRAARTADGVQYLEADAMLAQMRDQRFRAAMLRVLDAAEIRRLEEIVRNVQLLNQSQVRQPSIGDNLSGAESPRFVQVLARIAGANVATRTGAGSGNAGVSLQAANLGAGTANQLVDRLTADRASQILMDAVTDPRLFQSLLMDPASPRFEREALPRLIPYLVGTSAAVATPDE